MTDDGTESLLASDTAKEVYSTWKDLWDSGAVLPSSQDEAGPTWTAGFTEGKVGLMFYPATLLSSTAVRRRRGRHPRPRGRRLDVRRR